jgi:hypothetical protein
MLKTDQSAYSPGRSVKITLVVRNDGPACQGSEPAPYVGNCWFSFNVKNQQGQKVWDSDASPDHSGPVMSSCPAELSTTVPPEWTTSVTDSWNQDVCTVDNSGDYATAPNPDCPQSQVPAGRYFLGSQGAVPVAVTIS